MTEQEAIAVMRSLGHALTWTHFAGTIPQDDRTTDHWNGEADGKQYRVYCFSQGACPQKPYRADCMKPLWECCPWAFVCAAHAKAACDTHAVTGEWE